MSFEQDEFNRVVDKLVKFEVALIFLASKGWDDDSFDGERYEHLRMVRVALHNELDGVIDALPIDKQGDTRDDTSFVNHIAQALAIQHKDIESSHSPFANWMATFLDKSAKFWQDKGNHTGLAGREWPYR